MRNSETPFGNDQFLAGNLVSSVWMFHAWNKSRVALIRTEILTWRRDRRGWGKREGWEVVTRVHSVFDRQLVIYLNVLTVMTKVVCCTLGILCLRFCWQDYWRYCAKDCYCIWNDPENFPPLEFASLPTRLLKTLLIITSWNANCMSD